MQDQSEQQIEVTTVFMYNPVTILTNLDRDP